MVHRADRYDGVLDQLQVKYKDMVGDSMRKEAEFNHENDLEGVLIIVEKHASGGPQPVAVETIAHGHRPRALIENTDLSVTTGKADLMRVEDGHTLLYIESQKHGVHANTNEQSTSDEPIIVLRYGKTTEWSQVKDGEASYELVPIYKTIWKHARETHARSTTFGTVMDLAQRSVTSKARAILIARSARSAQLCEATTSALTARSHPGHGATPRTPPSLPVPGSSIR